MPAEVGADELANRRHVAFVLRLVVERHGALVYGEVLSLDSVPKGRFRTWQDLLEILKATLAASAQ